MHFVTVGLLSFLITCPVLAQTAPLPTPTSDAQAVSLAQQSIAALTGGASISDVTLNANVISILGPDSETGTATLQAKGTTESRVDLTLPTGTRSDVRSLSNGLPAGGWLRSGGTPTPYALHNCWTDAAWFFPALSSLSQSANPNFIFTYVALEQHGGVSTQHIRTHQLLPSDTNNAWNVTQLSAVDYFLDPVSSLPLAADFNAHPDTDMGTNIPFEIRFADYQITNGTKVPTHIQQMVDGSLLLDISVTNTTINTNLPETLFSLE